MRILIAGASGFLGTALTRHLETAGHLVVPLRRGPAGSATPTWDPAEGRLDPTALDGVDAIVNLAGESIAGGPWTAARRRRILESRRAGTTLLAEAAARRPDEIAVFVNASAVGIYGDRGDEALTEESTAGQGFLAEVGQAWEGATRPAAEAGIRVALPRLGILLDPAGGMLGPLLPLFRFCLGARLGDGRQWLSWITLDDAVGVFARLLEDHSLAGPINAVSPEPVRNAEFTAALGGAVGRPAPWVAPAPLLRLVLGDLGQELLLASQRCIPARLVTAGHRFASPTLVPALEEMLRPAEPAP